MTRFKIRCIGYKQNHERYFTIGQEYEVTDAGLVADDVTYTTGADDILPGTDPETWWLSGWYTFEIVDDTPVNIIYDDIFSIMDTGD
jgi:hypothetical protein